MNYLELFTFFKEKKLHGRYITNSHIEPILNDMGVNFGISSLGKSVLQNPIYGVKIGSGDCKILIWSQMHGNESTTTKAIFDFFSFLKSKSDKSESLLNKITFFVVPILNPDGAIAYTRENANAIDLNRDALDLSQPESVILRDLYHSFRPDYCFNMHDQRTIYGVGDTNLPATVSFLAPAFNENRDISPTRQIAINCIVYAYNELQKYIPNQVARYNDTYNASCVGDTFQSYNTPTILFESGHFPGDYEREETRKYIFIGLLKTFDVIYENDVVVNKLADYLKIPQNKVSFSDFIYKNIKINMDNSSYITTFAAQYEEILVNGEIDFQAFISEIDTTDSTFGHIEFEGLGGIYSDDGNSIPEIGKKADFYIDKNKKFVNGLIKK